MSRLPFLPIYLSVSAALAAQSVPAVPAGSPPIVLDRLVVSEKLDRAREDIVPSLGATQYRIDRAQIDALASGAAAAFNTVLLRAPGVAQDSYGQVHVRGEHANLQYRINEVLLPEGLTGFGQELDTRFVDTVNLLTGALPAQYGYRTSGIVDIHSRNPAGNAGEISLYGGSFDTLRASVEVGGTRGQLAGYVSASGERSDLGVENPTADRTAIHDRKNEFRTFGNFSYVLDDSSRVSLMLGTSFAHFQVPNNPGQDPAFALKGVPDFDSARLDETQREENHYAILAYQRSQGPVSGQLSAYSRYSLVAFQPDHDGDLIFNGVASRVRRAIVGNGLQADIRWSAAVAHTLRLGAMVAATNAGSRTTTAVFPVDAAGHQAATSPFDIADSERTLGWLYGAYVQDEWKPADGITVNFGARADTARYLRREGQFSPRLNFVWQPGERLTLHAGYARYFTPPPLELVPAATIGKFTGTTNAPAIGASSPVLSERSHYLDAGVSFQPAPGFTVGLDAYDKRATNLLDQGQFGAALIFSPFNYRRAHVAGIELTGNYSRGAFAAYVNLASSRATAREIISGEFQFDPDELAYIASHDVHLDHDQVGTISAGASYRAGRTLLYADLLYGSGLRRGFANTERLPAYHPVNVGVDHTFKLAGNRELHARLDVLNVFDESYELRDGSGIGVGAPQFGARRGFYGTLSWGF